MSLSYKVTEAIQNMRYPGLDVLYCCGIVLARRFSRDKGFVPSFLRMIRDMLSTTFLYLPTGLYGISDEGAKALAAALPTSKHVIV